MQRAERCAAEGELVGGCRALQGFVRQHVRERIDARIHGLYARQHAGGDLLARDIASAHCCSDVGG